jgi:hypothetical protein
VPNIKAKISAREVARLKPNQIIWDKEIKGFNCRRQRSDVLTFSLYYRTRDGKQRWFKLGRNGVYDADEMRAKAQLVLRNIDDGLDPAALRQEERHGMTVAEMVDAYVKDGMRAKKSSTIASDTSRIATQIIPRLGQLRAAGVTNDQVEDFLRAVPSASARRIGGLLSAIFNWAVKRQLCPSNPVKGVAPSIRPDSRQRPNMGVWERP